ncbi:MAG: hypothetical protein JNL70_25800, partial [Saprospiraceae bacterium]|nr:hypothetical protein [Saprospiraceae bacterium]
MKKTKKLFLPILCRVFYSSPRFGLFLLALLNVSLLLGQSKERVFTWNNDAFLQKVANAPMEKRANPQTQNQGVGQTLRVEIPMLDGSTQIFNIVESPVLEDPLKPNWIPVKTYQGHSDDLRTIIRFSVSEFGVTIFMNTPQGVLTLEPVDLSTQKYKISNVENPDFKCLKDEVSGLSAQAAAAVSCNSYGGTRRDYRFAMAATGEYTTFRGGTATVQSDITNLINYLNVLYEVEMALHFNLATGNDNIIYTSGATDPFTPDGGGNASAAAAQAGFSSAALIAVMPEANYDIGHVLHYEATGGGWSGQAGPGPCSGGGKARGWSQIRLGATFSIGPFGGVFGHEVGHQLGANHPFFGNAGSCAGGNRNPATAYEPGAATSFMSYNGSCSPQNIGSGSRDLYFHITNLNEMRAFLTGSGNSCSSPTVTSNSAPAANGNPNSLTFNIPTRTPFELTGSATDPEGNPLTYCWEEYDTDLASSGAAPNAAATTNNQPLFRSFPPTTSSKRIVPQLSDILAGTQTQGEILPEVARTMKFRLTVRDRYTSGGLTLGGWSCDEITINVVDIGATGFSLTSQNTTTSWTANGTNTATITWNVANTTAAPISCANVNILLSTDNGQTFPYTLASNVPNNGSVSVVIPSYPTFTGRIKIVPAANNIFFDINNAPITITSSCTAEAASVTPTTSVTALAGAAALNLGLTPQYGTTQTSWTANVPTGTPTMPLTFNQNGAGCAAPFSNSPAYTTYNFQVGLQGSYTFTLNSSSSTVMNLYQTSFDNTNTCSNWLGSSASGNVTTGTTITASLSPGVNYILVVSGFSTGHAAFSRTVTFTVPGGGSVLTGGPANPGASFNYAYLVLNTATNNITAIQATSNLTNTTTFPAGSYLVYGLSYQNTTTLAALQSYVGGTFTAFQNAIAALTFCGDLSSNSVSVTITSSCTAPTINAPTVTQPTCATATGTIVVNATGASTLEYSVDNGTNWSTNATFSNLASGNYNIQVRLQASPTCLSTYSLNPVVINTQPATPTAPSVGTITQPTCAVATGSVVLSGLPATGNWTLTRSPGGVTTTGSGTSTTISGL